MQFLHTQSSKLVTTIETQRGEINQLKQAKLKYENVKEEKEKFEIQLKNRF